MTALNRKQRGRPKGTGLDDRRHLKAIASLILKDEELKPTTAIRSLGITNPSTIRRLRDKFNCSRGRLLQEALNAKTIKENNNKANEHSRTENKTVARHVPHSQSTEATCALKVSSDPAIYEQQQPSKPKAKLNRSSPQSKPKRSNTPNGYEPDAQDIIGAWISFCTQFTMAATKTQIDVLEELQALPFAAQTQTLQNEAFSAWLKAMTLSPAK